MNFKAWEYVIIDGNNVCYTLYKKNFNWLLGGEYNKFGDLVREFFTKAGFNNPIVVFDGAGVDDKKLDTVMQRRMRAMLDMQSTQGRYRWNLDTLAITHRPYH